MATTGINFSVYANASVRPPINPKTGFSSTSGDLKNGTGVTSRAMDGHSIVVEPSTGKLAKRN
jgi:hypothetical protein